MARQPVTLHLLAAALRVAAMALWALAWPAATSAQDLGHVASPILTLDRDKLFQGTQYGQRVSRELEAASNSLAAETRRIEASLEEEEKALTAKRGTMAADEFRALADAFDQKVQSLRTEREQAQANMRKQVENAQLDFFNRIGPILGQFVRERGAVLIVDRRAILLAAADVDITQDAITRIDTVLGDGSALDQVTTPDLTAPTATPDTTTPTPDLTLPTTEGNGLDIIPAPADPATDATAAPATGTQ